MAKCSKYHAKCKVTMPKCCKYHAKWQVLVPNCCKYKANGTGKKAKNIPKPEAKKNNKYSTPYIIIPNVICKCPSRSLHCHQHIPTCRLEDCYLTWFRHVALLSQDPMPLKDTWVLWEQAGRSHADSSVETAEITWLHGSAVSATVGDREWSESDGVFSE